MRSAFPLIRETAFLVACSEMPTSRRRATRCFVATQPPTSRRYSPMTVRRRETVLPGRASMSSSTGSDSRVVSVLSGDRIERIRNCLDRNDDLLMGGRQRGEPEPNIVRVPEVRDDAVVPQRVDNVGEPPVPDRHVASALIVIARCEQACATRCEELVKRIDRKLGERTGLVAHAFQPRLLDDLHHLPRL